MKKVKLIALLTAVVAAVLLFNFLNSVSKTANVDVTKIGVVTASANIPPNTPITDEMLVITEMPLKAVQNESIKAKEAALGKVSSSEILAGNQILGTQLISSEGGSGNGTLAYEIKPGMRAISIGVSNLSGLVGMIKPKNTVDIIAQVQKPEKNTQGADEVKDYTSLLAENITVLAVDDVLAKEGKAKNEEGISYTTVTLQVTPQQALGISMAEAKGQLRLILRSPLDQNVTGLKSITFDNIIIK